MKFLFENNNIISDNNVVNIIVNNAERIRRAAIGDQAQSPAKQYKHQRRVDWPEAILLALQVKLESHTDDRDYLLSSDSAHLVETSPVDDF